MDAGVASLPIPGEDLVRVSDTEVASNSLLSEASFEAEPVDMDGDEGALIVGMGVEVDTLVP
jgi:hypothetical protein